MDIVAATKIALDVFGKLLDKMPTYNQKKRDSFLEMRRDYEFEINSEYPDCARIDDLRIRIMHHIGSEISNIN